MPPTNGELRLMVENIEQKLETHVESFNSFAEELKEAIKQNTEIGQQTLQQAIKTNGRVLALETWQKDADTEIKSYVKYRERALIAIVIILGIGSFVYSLVYNKLETDVTSSVNQNIIKTLETKYDISITK